MPYENPEATTVIWDRPEDAVFYVIPTGDLDAACAEEKLRRPIAAARAQGFHHVVVDLHYVRFIDTTSMAILLDLQRQLDADGGTMTLLHVSPRIRYYFESTRLSDVFDLG